MYEWSKEIIGQKNTKHVILIEIYFECCLKETFLRMLSILQGKGKIESELLGNVLL